MAGTGCQSTRETVELTRWAKDAGATGALVVAPYYLKPAFNEVFDHYKEVDKVELPMVLYNIPQCAGTHFQWWTAEGMGLAFDHVIGMKDSSGDMPFFMAALEKLRGTIGLFVGHDEIAGPALLAGADGAILASANLIPDIWQEIYQAAQRGDVEFVRQRHKEIQILVRIVARKGSPQAVKEGLRMIGLPQMSNVRLPMIQGGEFEREDYEDLRTQLENLGKIGTQTVVLGGKEVEYALPADVPPHFEDLTLCVGEGFAGPPFSEIAHIDLLLGKKDGPVGKAIARARNEPRPGHELAILSERPLTLLVPTVTVRGAKARQLVYEEAASGVKLALEHAIAHHNLPEAILDDVCLIANVFVHPAASIRQRVKINNYKAMRGRDPQGPGGTAYAPGADSREGSGPASVPVCALELTRTNLKPVSHRERLFILLLLEVIGDVDDHALKTKLPAAIEQRALEQLGGLVVKDVLPPLGRHELGQHHGRKLAVVVLPVGLVQESRAVA